jgi:hypothetical protein
MKDAFEAGKEDFNNWVDKWDKAVENGIFKDAPKPPSTCKKTSDDSFFGLQQTNPTDSISSGDSDYWRAINSVADGGVAFERLDEVEKEKYLPNPIHLGTEGEDQKMEPHQLGVTFSEEDIKNLEEMKVKLHELQSKIASMDDKSYDSQVKSIISGIEDLSNKMSRVER